MSIEVTPAELDPKLLTTVVDYHAEVEEARREFDDAKERLKTKKTRLEAAQESFESAFRRLISAAQGGELPLFANQSEVLDRANNDPVVSALVERLLARGHDVNSLIVAGYTDDERAAVTAYLDTLDHNDAELEKATDGETAVTLTVEVPAFLIPQPLTPIEVASFLDRLATAGHDVAPATVEAWGLATRRDVSTWLDDVERITAEKGDALVSDDLPSPPSCLVAEADPEPEQDDADATVDEAAEERATA